MIDINEAYQTPGATFIGTGKGYDLFDITTWAAANSFLVADRTDSAGSAYVHSEDTFNRHILNTNTKLYYFTEQNTNHVYGALISSSGSFSICGLDNRFTCGISSNYTFEDAGDNSSTIKYQRKLPLYLIPNFSAQNIVNNCMLLNSDNTTLIAVLPELNPENEIDVLDTRNLPITNIDRKAFSYGLPVRKIILSENIRELPSGICSVNSGFSEICVVGEQPDPSWSINWNSGNEDITTYNYGVDPEEIQRRAEEKRQREIAAKMESAQKVADYITAKIGDIEITLDDDIINNVASCKRLLDITPDDILQYVPQEIIEKVKEARDKIVRLKSEEEAKMVRYKIVGNEVTITGTRKGYTTIKIPESINDKPVTKVAPYAFYDNENLRRVEFAKSAALKEIGQGAFAECPILDGALKVSASCIIGKQVTYNTPNFYIHK